MINEAQIERLRDEAVFARNQRTDVEITETKVGVISLHSFAQKFVDQVKDNIGLSHILDEMEHEARMIDQQAELFERMMKAKYKTK